MGSEQAAADAKTHVSIRTTWPDPLWRQLAPGADYMDSYIFDLANNAWMCDVCVVCHDVPQPIETTCMHGIVALTTCEPNILNNFYPQGFLDQFDVIFSDRGDLRHPRVIRTQPMLAWWVGVGGGHAFARDVRMHYKDLCKPVDPAVKTRGCSMICSSKAVTESHRRRLAFARAIGEHPEVDLYGYGHIDLHDKWDALHQYRVHIGIENSSSEHYWTEKASDAFLAESFLLYSGCTNFEDYFPKDSFMRIDLDDLEGTVAAVKQASTPEFYQSRLPAIREAKRRVLEEHNLFPNLARLIDGVERRPEKKVRILPQDWFPLGRRKTLKHRIKKAIEVMQ